VPANRPRRISILLEDHFAGASGGLELAKRLEQANSGTEFAAPLADLRHEIEADRETLLRLMRELGVAPSRAKVVAVMIGERLGRLKPNGQLRGYSPLSRLIELEALLLGITGKQRLWILCAELVGERSGLDFAALAERAEAQRQRTGELQVRAAELL
jgi:hypothetical protein